MIKKDDVYRIGRIGKTHGVNGEVSFSFDDDVFFNDDAEYLILDVDGILVPFFMEECRLKNDSTALVKFENINSQERAKQLTGCDVYFPRRSSADDEAPLSIAELIGFSVVDDATGKTVGTLRSADYSTINPLFEVINEDGEAILLPAADELIAGVNVQKGQIMMHLPDGLLDLNKKKV